MCSIIPSQISDGEFFARFITKNHLKNRNKPPESISDINSGEVYTNPRGVSIQRETYSGREDTIERSNLFVPPSIGFAIFSKQHYNTIVSEITNEHPNFEASIEASPMDELERYIVFVGNIIVNSGNYSHADIFILNPDPAPHEVPNTVRRKFSRKLFSKSQIHLF